MGHSVRQLSLFDFVAAAALSLRSRAANLLEPHSTPTPPPPSPPLPVVRSAGI